MERRRGSRVVRLVWVALLVAAPLGCDSTSPEPAPVPTALVFQTEPAEASGGAPFTTQPVVEVLDQKNERLVGTAVSVTVGLGSNPSGGRLSGVTTVNTTTGLAVFSDLAIDKAGSGYTLVASVSGVVRATSAFDVIVGPPVASRSTVSVNRSRALPDDSVTLTLLARDAGGNALANGGSTVIFTASGGTSQGGITATTDNGDGTYTARFVADGAGTALTIGATVNGAAVTADLPTLTVVAFIFVSAGTSAFPGFTCGVFTDGTAHCWGNGLFGQLGNGTLSSSTQLKKVGGNHEWSAIAAGAMHVCGRTVGGVAYCWGSGDVGALGNASSGHGSADNQPLPVLVSTDRTFEFITATFNASCAITADGSAWCWGSNVSGRLGDGTDSPTNVPRMVSGSHSWQSIGVGIAQGCGITTNGAAYCWGSGSLTPLAVPGQNSFRPGSIAVGGNHACAVTLDGVALCWGKNWAGQLGDGTTTPNSTPVAVAGALRFSELTAGDEHTCGVTENGDAYCWGGNDTGQLGDGTHTAANSPRLVVGGFQFTQVSAGQAHTCGVTTRGVVLCWGQNNEGQLGDGLPVSSRAIPVRVDVR